MENEIISLFLNRKKQNISRYTEIFAKYTLNGNVKLNKIINKIVEIYYDNYYLDKNLDFSLLTKYFEITKTKESIMKDVLLSSILFYKNSGLEEQIDNDIKNIVVLSNLIYLAINLDEYVNEFKNEKYEIDDRINSYFERFKDKIRCEQDYELLKNEITSLVKKDVIAEKKFWKLLIDDTYNLEFFQCLKNNNLFKVKYSYNIKMLNRYDNNEVEKASLTKSINDDMLTIYLEKLSITILKNLLYRHIEDLFFIEITDDYFNKNKNLISLDKIFSNKVLKKCVVFCFKFSNLKKEIGTIKYLTSKGYSVCIIDIDSDKLSSNTFDHVQYAFIDSDTLDNNKEYEQIWSLKDIKFIVDNNEFIEIKEEKIFKCNR